MFKDTKEKLLAKVISGDFATIEEADKQTLLQELDLVSAEQEEEALNHLSLMFQYGVVEQTWHEFEESSEEEARKLRNTLTALDKFETRLYSLGDRVSSDEYWIEYKRNSRLGEELSTLKVLLKDIDQRMFKQRGRSEDYTLNIIGDLVQLWITIKGTIPGAPSKYIPSSTTEDVRWHGPFGHFCHRVISLRQDVSMDAVGSAIKKFKKQNSESLRLRVKNS